ncbi:MAG: biopolymer transporter ExbD [Firmicutes bacterium]|nr:biopolymer transporter ExbD [Bacillota bacterium]
MNIERAKRKKMRLEIIPMIDVLFFLLVFFMLFSTFKTNVTGLNINLPRAVTVTAQEQSKVVVTVARDGAFYLGRQQVDEQRLKAELHRALGSNGDAVVVIEADEAVLYKHLVAAMDAVRQAGGYRIALAVDRKAP